MTWNDHTIRKLCQTQTTNSSGSYSGQLFNFSKVDPTSTTPLCFIVFNAIKKIVRKIPFLLNRQAAKNFYSEFLNKTFCTWALIKHWHCCANTPITSTLRMHLAVITNGHKSCKYLRCANIHADAAAVRRHLEPPPRNWGWALRGREVSTARPRPALEQPRTAIIGMSGRVILILTYFTIILHWG